MLATGPRGAHAMLLLCLLAVGMAAAAAGSRATTASAQPPAVRSEELHAQAGAVRDPADQRQSQQCFQGLERRSPAAGFDQARSEGNTLRPRPDAAASSSKPSVV